MSRSSRVVQIINALDYWLAVQVVQRELTIDERAELARALRDYLGPVPDWAKLKDTTEPRLLDTNLVENLLSASIDSDYEPGTKCCPKCGAASGDNWSQCEGTCPMLGSPHYSDLCAHAFEDACTVGAGVPSRSYTREVAAAAAEKAHAARTNTPRKPEFSYIRLSDNKAKVTCTCGWEDPLGPMPVSPFDPAEALAAAYAEHPRCQKAKP